MYAVRVESLEAEAGSDVTLNEVLMLGNGESVTLGAPLVANASVSAHIVLRAISLSASAARTGTPE